MRTLKISSLIAVMALAACTTEFSKDRDADDVITDTTGDADATVDVEPDTEPEVITDGPEDVPTDTLPPDVACRLERTKDILFPTGYGGTNIEVGCWTGSGGFGCQQANIWVKKVGSRLVVAYGGEQIIMGTATRAAADVLEMTGLDLLGTTPAASPFGLGYEPRMIDATLVRRTGEEVVLLYTVEQRESGLDRESNIEVVVWHSLSGGTFDVTMNRLLENWVHESVGDLVGPSAVRSPTTGRAHIFFGVRYDDGSGWEVVQFWGNYMNPGGLRSGSFSHYTDFEPVVGDYTQMVLTARPDCLDEVVVLPWTVASLSPPILDSGAIVIDTGTVGLGYDHPFTVKLNAGRPYVSSISGQFLDPGTYAVGALTTSALTMVGLNPPYDVVSTVADATAPAATIEAPPVHTVDRPFISEPEFFDFNDPVVLHQDESPVHFYVTPFFHVDDGGMGHAWVFPLHPDGTLAGDPLPVPMDQTVPPAFDAAIDPETGHVFLAWMHDTVDPSALERIPGYTIAEVVCE